MGDILLGFGGLDAVAQRCVGRHQQDAAGAEHENNDVGQTAHLWRVGWR